MTVAERYRVTQADRTAGRVPGLDGLRGVAVVWVVAFHLWPDVVRGGWLGVSLFFTLSGYLILGLIDAEVSATGRLRLGRFMARRVRRLMPAGLLTISATVALTAVLTDAPLREIGLDALTAALNVFNWRSATDPGGYAAIFEVAASPLEHFWSLAIEEQFYLLVPASVALTRRSAHVVAAMVVAGLGGVALWWGSTDAYVATPVRALEIAAGAALALAAARSETVRRLVRWAPERSRATRAASVAAVVVALAVAELAVAWLGPTHDAVFRGGPQLMALCWVVLLAASLPGGPLAPLMSLAPLRWLGTRSYAIYLFHWPLIELTDWSPVTVIVVTLLAAEASYHMVEMPMRRGTGHRTVLVLVGAAVAIAVVSATVAAASSPARGAAERTAGATELPEWVTAEPDDTETADTETADTEKADTETADTETSDTETAAAPAEQPAPPTAVEKESTAAAAPAEQPAPPAARPNQPPASPAAVPIVTVIGDSTAVHVADGLRRWADTTRTMAVVDRAISACSPVMTSDRPWRVIRTGDDADPRHLREYDRPCRYSYIEPGSSLVLVVDHSITLVDHQRADGSWASVLDEDLAADLADAYRDLVEAAQAMNAQVVFTTAPHWLPLRGESGDPPPATEAARTDAYNRIVRTLVEELDTTDHKSGPSLIETAAELDASGYDGRYGRSDGSHIDFDRSEAFAAEVLGPALLSLKAER